MFIVQGTDQNAISMRTHQKRFWAMERASLNLLAFKYKTKLEVKNTLAYHLEYLKTLIVAATCCQIHKQFMAIAKIRCSIQSIP